MGKLLIIKTIEAILNKQKPIKAKTKLEIGPIRATIAISLLGLLKLLVLIGTGLAHPKPIVSIAITPIGSRCFKGFNVSLPCCSAVLSPSNLAQYP